MKKVIFLSVIMLLVLATVSWAAIPNTGPRITYGGYVERDPVTDTVSADTLICVFNPNNFAITGVGIAVYDKYGTKVNDVQLLNGGFPISQILAKGWGWQTIGNMVGDYQTPEWTYPGVKYTFVVYWTKPTQTPNRGLVIEIKEIIYTMRVYPKEGPWLPSLIKFWSEAAIGMGGTGYKAQ